MTALESSETRTDTYVAAGEKALHTADRPFRQSLAALVAAGLRDDLKVDEVAYLVSVLTQLEPVHLALLKGFMSARESKWQDPGYPTLSFAVRHVAESLKVPLYVGKSAAERLLALWLLTDRKDGQAMSWGPEKMGGYSITEAGASLLSYCETVELESSSS